MAAHSCGVLKERFAKTQSLHRHETEQRVWAAPNKRLQGKGLCIYKDIACKSLLGAAQTRRSASAGCRLRICAKCSFSTPQECAAITEA